MERTAVCPVARSGNQLHGTTRVWCTRRECRNLERSPASKDTNNILACDQEAALSNMVVEVRVPRHCFIELAVRIAEWMVPTLKMPLGSPH